MKRQNEQSPESRIAELEKELEIEASLERVRTVAMGMRDPQDLLNICKALFGELQLLEFADLRNAIIQTYDDDKSYFNDYDYSDFTKGHISQIPYVGNPIIEKFVKDIRKTKDAFTEIIVSDEELKQWKVFRDNNNEAPDERLSDLHSLYYYIYSIGSASIGISTFKPVPADKQEVLKRFRNVFDLAYSRYVDIEQALARAKAAQLEASLERMRAVAMGMNKPEDLLSICETMFHELKKLGFDDLRNAMIDIHYEAKSYLLNYDYSDNAGKTITTFKYGSHPIVDNLIYHAKQSSETFTEMVYSGKALDEWRIFRKQNGEADDTRLDNIETLSYYFYSIGTGAIGISTFSAAKPKQLDVLKRFRNVFDLAYRRYTDIEKASAQAKEAQIEASLERVRAVAMSMRQSDELINVCEILYKELLGLGFTNIRNAQIAINNDERQTYSAFEYADYGANVKEASYDTHKLLQEIEIEVKRSMEALFQKQITGQELDDWRAWRKRIGLLTDQRVMRANSMCFYLYSIGMGMLGISTYDAISSDQLETLKRFKNVCELAYRRYADVAQAEAQAREAQIELGLERVRARAMAMQSSNELADLVTTLFNELAKLDFALSWCMINIIDGDSLSNTVWAKNADEGGAPERFHMKFEGYPFHNAMWDAWKARLVNFVYTLEGDEKKIYDEYLFNQTEFSRLPEPVKARMRATGRYVASFSFSNFGGLQTVGDEPLSDASLDILSRFGKVFDLTYTRFNDLKLAEAQAREAQIELGLERVRARAMAMQSSDELAGLISCVFSELAKLGFGLRGCGLYIIDEATKSCEVWIISPANVDAPERLQIVLNDLPFPGGVWNAWKERQSKWVYDLAGAEKQTWHDYLLNETDFSRLPDPVKAAIRAPERLRYSFSFGNFGGIQTVGEAPLFEANLEVLSRFTNVFDLTYTRFNDLKQAEIQAREAQIELGLERVRSRAMAMQNSDELADLVTTLFNELAKLHFTLARCLIWIIDADTLSATTWMANPGVDAASYQMKYFDHPYYKGIIKAWKERKSKWAYELKGEEKRGLDDIVLNLPALKDTPEVVKAAMRAVDEAVLSFSFSNFGGLQVDGTEPLSEDNLNILARFSKVFDQTYTRFSDLKKAEAQAREGQIELALERVRARTMAMQQSDELQDAASLMFQQIEALGISTFSCGYNIFQPGDDFCTSWMSNHGQLQPPFEIPLDGNGYFIRFYNSKKNREDFWVEELVGDEIKAHYEYLFSVPGVQAISALNKQNQIALPAHQVNHVVNFSQGNLLFITYGQVPEAHDIFKRFGKTFEQTYTRFLDLQKAETQARESQIELALERVRARTMAMQHSDELAETAYILFQQFRDLGENPDQATIGIINEAEGVIEYWVTIHGSQTNRVFKFPIDEPNVTQTIYKAWKKHEKSLVIDLSGKALHDFSKFRESMGGAGYKPEEKRRIINVAFFSKGLINVQSTAERSVESLRLLERFANVFEGTYTRFLDLQRAEAQAREAKIEAGLERVRAKAMSMQTSEELNALLGTVFDELTKLDLVLTRCVIIIYEPETNSCRWWMANSEAPSTPMNFFVKYHKLRPYMVYLKGWQDRVLKWQYVLKGKVKRDWDDFLFTETELSLLSGFVIAGMKAPGEVLLSSSFYNFGCLTLASLEPLPDEGFEIMLRFGKVFDMSYTRFNDLKQAEAQAREAKIELALERVRARTMAMYHSEELAQTAAVLFQQLSELGDEPARISIGIPDERNDTVNFWATDQQGDQINISFNARKSEQTMSKMYGGWKEKIKSLAINLEGKELNEWVRFCREEMGIIIKDDLLKKQRVHTVGYFSHGWINYTTHNPLSAEIVKVLERFAAVFEQTYRRFLDLQKAERQAKEAKIEAALEKVRAEAMAMHDSNDVGNATALVFSELYKLGISTIRCGVVIIEESTKLMEVWSATSPEEGKIDQGSGKLDMTSHPLWQNLFDTWKQKKPVLTYELMGQDLLDYYKAISSAPGYKAPELDPSYAISDDISKARQYCSCFLFAEGGLFTFTGEAFPPEESKVLEKFAAVFSLTYRRYLDLKQAEAQAREAKIQLALERVRARTMAMQQSGELAETSVEVFKQLIALGIQPNRLFIGIINDDSGNIEMWATNEDGSKISSGFTGNINRNGSIKKMHAGWKAHKKSLTIDMQGKELKDYFHYLSKELKVPFKLGLSQKRRVVLLAYFPQGFIGMASLEPQPETTTNLLERFAGVFNLTYTRFLDLQKAEAQAREGQIQLAMERVRARTMAMQRSDELPETANLLFKQVQELGMPAWSAGYCNWTDNKKAITFWMSSEGVLQPPFSMPTTTDPSSIHMREAAERGETFYVEEVGGEALVKHYEYMRTLPVVGEVLDAIINAGHPLPTFQIFHLAYFAHGFLLFITYEAVPQAHDIFKRFAAVFEQTYTRFLDLQKAEAQAREAKIEAALERVRSRTMGMQKSEELKEIIQVVYDQFDHLNIPVEHAGFIVDYKTRDDMNIWLADKHYNPAQISIPYFDSPHWNSFREAKQNGLDFFANYHTFEEKNKFYQDLFKVIPGVTDEAKEFYFNCPGLVISTVLLDNVGLYIENFSVIPYAGEENSTLMRFGKVFQQTYTRFLDLQKAEAQAREGQIQLALERVRARTMAMQKSDELAETVSLLFKQLLGLGIRTEQIRTCGIVTFDDKKPIGEQWITETNGEIIPKSFIVPYDEAPAYKAIYKSWKNGEKFKLIHLEGDALKEHLGFLAKDTNVPTRDLVLPQQATEIFNHVMYFSQGCLFIITKEALPEYHEVFKRFGAVFQQSYVRFLDLQKAEIQARQAQIEVAMEKVRSRSLAMQKPAELTEVAELLRRELGLLGVEALETSSIYIRNEASGVTECWYAIKDDQKLVADHMYLDLNDTWVGRKMLEFYRSGEKQTSIRMQGENRKEWIDYCAKQSTLLDGFYGDHIPDRFYHLNKFSNGYMGAASPGDISAESWELLQRATAVFSFAYTRFSDLQQAELLAAEATRRASLDRVRAEIASMRSTRDLERITPLVWNELTILGIPFIRCGVFIVDEAAQAMHTHLSTPHGKALAAFDLSFDSDGIAQNVLPAWRRKQIATDYWDAERFMAYTKNLVEQGAITEQDRMVTEHPGSGLDLHFFPFLQGMLYVGNSAPLNDNEKDLVQSLAEAFSTAYARYEDFNKLEVAKLQVDKTLTDLKAAQTQLIQNEKMASLGELTAGIAHEIQNPLNFVNNFSEVNAELIGEMKEEIEKGDLDEILALAKDIEENSKKINMHGKRADGIVKGMLQHSKSGSAAKELTNINSIADEYMRLAYHGLRAKDKTFNAEMVTHFDPDMPKIMVIGQDIGRVMLNLFNNAFYAVNQKQKTAGPGYKPEVAVSSFTENGQVVVVVNDNGIGIPDAIKEKIMQPFFTTKPTGEGTGLGLSLTYDMVVKGHGGSIQVESVEGEGSEFIIKLPIS